MSLNIARKIRNFYQYQSPYAFINIKMGGEGSNCKNTSIDIKMGGGSNCQNTHIYIKMGGGSNCQHTHIYIKVGGERSNCQNTPTLS